MIILDLADPMEEGPCYLLYTVEFYEMVKTRLNPGGVFITQSGPASLITMKHVYAPIYKTLVKVTLLHPYASLHTHHQHHLHNKVWKDKVYPSVVHIPSFADCYGFNLFSGSVNMKDIHPSEIDKLIEERIEGRTNNDYIPFPPPSHPTPQQQVHLLDFIIRWREGIAVL